MWHTPSQNKGAKDKNDKIPLNLRNKVLLVEVENVTFNADVN